MYVGGNSMRAISTYILTFLTLFSCRSKHDQALENSIIGEWTFTKTEDNRKKNQHDKLFPPPPPFGKMTNGYIFSDSGQCENKIGYFKRIEASEREDRKTLFLGNNTKYKVEDDSLKIYDLAKNIWKNTKIYSIIGDTLTLQTSDSIFAKYSKVVYKIDKNESYDKIIVSSSGCYGSCPIMTVSIENSGKLCYLGQNYNTINGLFTSNISKTEYLKLENNFKKSGIASLDEHYSAGHTDDETVSVTFIKNRKIVKTIYDYGSEAPTEFIWAYTPVRYLYQRVKLQPFKIDKTYLPMRQISFETKNKICNLTKSESFYLLTELQYGKIIPHKFEEKYKIVFWNDKDEQEIIYTDGRFFKFTDNQKIVTIDLGYNFLTVNDLIKKFRTKNEYE